VNSLEGDTLDPDDLGLLVWCALSYDRRLPGGNVPNRTWEALTPEWRAKLNKWKNASRGHLGAQVRGPRAD
jgi:hypothetical protein